MVCTAISTLQSQSNNNNNNNNNNKDLYSAKSLKSKALFTIKKYIKAMKIDKTDKNYSLSK